MSAPESLSASSSTSSSTGRHVDVGDTRLWVVERGREDAVPLLVLHGGPGLDHHEFADYLDPLGDLVRLVLVDLRAQGLSDRDSDPATWTIDQMARDVDALGKALGGRYAVLGHSYGAFVALAHAVSLPGAAVATVVSCGVPSFGWLDGVEANLATFEPEHLREQVAASWAREESVSTPEEFAELMHDQEPFHFADPLDPRIADYQRRTAGTVYAPDVLRAMAASGYGGLDVEDRLGAVTSPLLALAGRHDRTCPADAAGVIAAGVPDGRAVVFERSGHMPFVEEQEAYLDAVRSFLAGVV
ncbi:MAG: alpha/beta fold hydrolase [Motilibacteraceae bacterium]